MRPMSWAGGMSVVELIADFPDLAAQDIQVRLSFAADHDRRLSITAT
jgi:uncharacterized protein (DUF433 family)